MSEFESLQNEIELLKKLIMACDKDVPAESFLTALLQKEKKLEGLTIIQRSSRAYFMRQKCWEMVVELYRVDEFGGREILQEMVSFPADIDSTNYQNGLSWAADNGIVIENIDEFAPIEVLVEKDLL